MIYPNGIALARNGKDLSRTLTSPAANPPYRIA
jgi:hypothetical protein